MNSLKLFLFTLLFIIPAASFCQHNQTFDRNTIEKNIKSLGHDVVRDLNELDTVGLMSHFHQSESTLFVIDGMKMKGYGQIRAGLGFHTAQIMERELIILDQSVEVLSPDMAIQVVEFTDEVTPREGETATSKGTWTSLYKKMDDGWKVVMVHESHQRGPRG